MYEDPWTALDPHAEDEKLFRPYRRGKANKAPEATPYVAPVPASAASFLEALNTQVLPAAQSASLPALPPPSSLAAILAGWVAQLKPAGPRHLRNCRPPQSAGALSGTYFASQFGVFHAAEQKRQQDLRRTVQRDTQQAPADLVADPGDCDDQLAREDYDAENFDAGVFSDGEDDEDVLPINMDELNDELNSGGSDSDGRLSMVVKSFEDLCREYMDQHNMEAEKLSNDAGMTQRVASWQGKLDPILESEELRKPFDIHEYGDELLHRLEAKGEGAPPAEFRALLHDSTRYDICRMFLASLQLANGMNVDIVALPAQETIGLVLLNSARHEMLENVVEKYRAPSAAETEGLDRPSTKAAAAAGSGRAAAGGKAALSNATNTRKTKSRR